MPYRAALTRTLLTKPPVQLMNNYNFSSLPSQQPICTNLPVQSSIDMAKILKKVGPPSNRSKQKCLSVILKINAVLIY
jgi:hypothetical protein